MIYKGSFQLDMSEQNLLETNTLAYFAAASAMENK
jgi:hypothetical protein